MRKPKYFRSFAFRWLRVFPSIPVPTRLPFGAWWLLRNDQISACLLEGTFEKTECTFVEKSLRQGMTFLDVGANQGFYTLLASRKVGAHGHVLSFEPSIREMKRLKLHLKLNRCSNVQTSSSALGTDPGTGELHIVMGSESGCNSLRPPDVAQPTTTLSVPIERLDDVLKTRGIDRVDFVKLDVEGAELSVLQGAKELLTRLRPVLLVEVQDIRTSPWGYPAEEILSFVAAFRYQWFAIQPDGRLEILPLGCAYYDGNFVAIPPERVASLKSLIAT